MAGVGVLALPSSMIHTGPAGFFLIVYFTLNAIFVGRKLGVCWLLIEEMFPEFRNEVNMLEESTYWLLEKVVVIYHTKYQVHNNKYSIIYFVIIYAI